MGTLGEKIPNRFIHNILFGVLRSNDKFSHEKADRELGYHPRDLYDTLKDTVKWMASSGMLKKADSLSFAASEK